MAPTVTTCCSSSSIPSSVLTIKLILWLNDLTEKMCASVSGSCAYSTEFDCIKFYLRSSNNVTVTMAPAVTTCCSSSSTTSVVIITSKIGNEARTRITSLYSSSVNFLKRDRRSSSWKQTDIQNYFPMESSQIVFCSNSLKTLLFSFFNIRLSKLEGSKHINDISVMTKAWKKGHLKSYKWNFYLHDKNFRLRHFWAHRVHFITSGETWDIKIRILMMTYVTFLVQLYP